MNFKKMVAKLGENVLVALIVTGLLASFSGAVNKIPLKPDGANSAPCTVYGSPNNGMSCGKTTAPSVTLDVAGSEAISGTSTIGLHVWTKTAIGSASGILTGIYISTTIPVTSNYETLISSGGNIIITATPSIATSGIASGTYVTLTSTTSVGTITLQDEAGLTGSKLQLGASTRVITQYKVLKLVYDADDGFWREISFGNN